MFIQEVLQQNPPGPGRHVAGGSESFSEASESLSDASEWLSSPYVAEYTMADAGKTAHYRLRWVFNNGEKSPWSEIESATIAG